MDVKTLVDNDWLWVNTIDDIKIFRKTSQVFNLTLMHIGFLFDKHWHSYCVFLGDQEFIVENLAYFKCDILQQQNWAKRVRNLERTK